MSFKFEKLNVWHKALDLSVEISELSSSFPPFELYNLSNQIRRAADSVVLNIRKDVLDKQTLRLQGFFVIL